MADASAYIWNSSPLTIGEYLVKTGDSADAHLDRSGNTLLTKGITTLKSKIIVYNHLHAMTRESPLFRQLAMTDTTLYSYEQPPPGVASWNEQELAFVHDLTAAQVVYKLSLIHI